LLTVGEPNVNTDGVVNLTEIHGHVLEITGEGTTGSGHLDDTGGDFNSDCRRLKE
jgi:hypothetical protein